MVISYFLGDRGTLHAELRAGLDILDHNTERVPRLFKRYRSRGVFKTTFDVLAWSHAYRVQAQVPMRTKTGIMLGLGPTMDEILVVMDDLHAVHCDVLTLSQYRNPTAKHAPIVRLYTPEEIVTLKEAALAKGFLHCESGPLVRSSYHAHENFPKETMPVALG